VQKRSQRLGFRGNAVLVVAELVIPIVMVGYWLNNLRQATATTMQPARDFIGERQINSAGTWSVQKMSFSGKDAAPGDRLLLFDFRGRCYYRADNRTLPGTFRADHDRHTFQLSGLELEGDRRTIQGTYRVDGDRLIMQGQRGGEPAEFVLQRRHWGKQLPFSAGR